MKYRKMGKSGLKISEISLGSWLTYGGNLNEESSSQCIDRAYELGINYFDTSNNYQAGQSEISLGNALKKYDRSTYVVATKGFREVGTGPNQKGLSRKYIIEQVDNSLRRLQMDYVDIWYCHRFDPETPLDETLRAIDDLVTQGKILYPGISMWTVEQMEMGLTISKELGLDPIQVNQSLYNMLERDIEKEVMPYCLERGIGLVAHQPLAQGLLTGKYSEIENPPENSRLKNNPNSNASKRVFTQENFEYTQQLKNIADTKQCTLAQLSLAWSLNHPEVTSALIGASRLEQIEDNIKALDVQLSQEDIEKIDQILD